MKVLRPEIGIVEIFHLLKENIIVHIYIYIYAPLHEIKILLQ